MSDNEYSDIDIESNNASPGNSGSMLDDSKKHARAQHNALERRRRDNIKDMYSSLKDEISNFNNSERASRAHILKKTIDTIEGQKEDVQALDAEVKQINEENARLLKEIQEAEAATRLPESTVPNA